jgi:hypothetical protein
LPSKNPTKKAIDHISSADNCAKPPIVTIETVLNAGSEMPGTCALSVSCAA